MSKASKYFLTAASALMMLTGCGNKENEPDLAGGKAYPAFTATIDGANTRAFDQSWEQGDEIGISGAGSTNVCHFTATGNGMFNVKTSGEQIYFQNDNTVTFTAYYPWNNLAGGVTAINTDTRKQEQQKAFDFLWAQASGQKDAPVVSFNFTHKMTKVVLTVKPGDGMSYDEIKSARLSLDGIRHTGAFNTTDGTTTVDSDNGVWSFSDFAHFNDTDRALTFSLIFFPQKFEKPMAFLAELDLPGNNILSLRANIDFTGANGVTDGTNAKNEWVSGRQYNLSLTLNKTNVTLNKCVINPWNVVTVEEVIVD